MPEISSHISSVLKLYIEELEYKKIHNKQDIGISVGIKCLCDFDMGNFRDLSEEM